jgi:hypothetical protein
MENTVAKQVLMLVGIVVSMAALVGTQRALADEQAAEHRVVPLKILTKLPTDKRVEKVAGDPAIAGAPYVIRIHAEPGYVIMPHTHEVDENIVVVKGSWALGMGAHFNRETLEPMEVGAYAFAPRNVVHFAFSKTATIIQVHGIGPFATHWLLPMYELSDQGVVLRETAGGPGRAVSDTPEGCFLLRLGTRVRAAVGEGLVVGAQCTPGQLTQYRVEKSDGELFWAQRDELTVL